MILLTRASGVVNSSKDLPALADGAVGPVASRTALDFNYNPGDGYRALVKPISVFVTTSSQVN